MKIADIHAHIFPEKLAEKASHSIGSFYGVSIEREADMPRLCAEDKLAGITRCVVSNSATNASQVQNAQGNPQTLFLRKYLSTNVSTLFTLISIS